MLICIGIYMWNMRTMKCWNKIFRKIYVNRGKSFPFWICNGYLGFHYTPKSTSENIINMFRAICEKSQTTSHILAPAAAASKMVKRQWYIKKRTPNTKINLSANIYHSDTHRGTKYEWNWANNEPNLKRNDEYKKKNLSASRTHEK